MVSAAQSDEIRQLPKVIGVLNVTPDSFSDGGLWLDPDAGLRHGLAMASAGADWVEVGGESTRPGARRTPEPDERHRVMPVVERLVASGVRVAVDTMRASIAADAIEAGADLINDVSGGLADPDMLPLIADAGVRYVCMHWRGHSETMQAKATYADPVTEVIGELLQRLDAARRAGIAPERLIVDPGIGFAKTADHSWELLQGLGTFVGLGYPVLLGASRKGFLGRLLVDPDGTPRSPQDRDAATTALSMHAYRCGAWGVRVHDPRSSRDAMVVAQQLDTDPYRSATE